MKKLSGIGLFAMLIMLALGCANYAEKTAGEFTGSFYQPTDTVTGSATITKTGDIKIKIDFTDSLGTINLSVEDVEVVASANNTYNLSGSNLSGYYFDNSKMVDLSYTESGSNFVFKGTRF